MKYWIPNAVTALNLVLGMISLGFTMQGDFVPAGFFIVAAMIADGLDGRVARALGASSEFGKELDSLCDLVSFGVAPALLAYQFALKEFGWIGFSVAIFFALCGALRLARFNVNTTTVKGYFMGLPIPAGGCLVGTFVALGYKPSGWTFPILIAIFAYLMVSSVHYPDFKGKGNEQIHAIPVILTAVMAGYILWHSLEAIVFVIFFSYAFFGVLNFAYGLFGRQRITAAKQ